MSIKFFAHGAQNAIVTTAGTYVLAIAVLSAYAVAARAEEPNATDVLQRLERTERQLALTQAQLEALRQRDARRQEWEQSITKRLPDVDRSEGSGESVFIPANLRSLDDDIPMQLEEEVKQLDAAVHELGAGMQEMKTGVEELAKSLRVTTLDENIKIGVFGWLRGEMLLSEQRPLISSAPFLLSPDNGLDQQSVDVHGKSTGIGAGIEGPCICGYDSGGLVLIYFFGDTVLANTSGVFLAQAYGELKSDYDRLAFGVQTDIFSPRNPTVVNWAMYAGAGNTGYLRGQLRYERFIKPSDTVQWTLTGGLSNPAPNNLLLLESSTLLSEGNGWPNVEGRVGLGLGCEYQAGMETRRPLEVGVSGVVGEVRSTFTDLDPPPARNRKIADVWGIGGDVRVALTDRLGVQGEVYKGRGLGTYSGTILQVINPVTLDTIDSEGAWGEVYYYLTPCLHTHVGGGFDDVDEDDVALGQRTYNRAIFANLMWDVTSNFQVAFEISHWRTDYKALPAQFIFGDNEGMIYHFRMQYSF